MGFPGALRDTYGATFGEGKGPILLDEVECIGTETNIGECDYLSVGESNCGHDEDAGVVCVEREPVYPVRLIGGSSSSEGRVELFHANRWGTVSILFVVQNVMNHIDKYCKLR